MYVCMYVSMYVCMYVCMKGGDGVSTAAASAGLQGKLLPIARRVSTSQEVSDDRISSSYTHTY